MKETKKGGHLLRAIAVCMAVLLMVLSLPQSVIRAEASSDSSIDADKQQLALIEEKLEAAKAARQNASSSYQTAASAYADAAAEQADALALKNLLDKEIESLEEEVAATNELLVQYNEMLETYRTEIEQKKTEIAEKYEEFKARIRLSYEDSLVTYLEIILTADSFTDMLSRVEIVGSMMDYDARLMKELDAARTSLEASETEYQALQLQAQQRIAELNEKAPELEQKKKENAELLEKLAKEVQEALSNANATAAQLAKAQSIESTYEQQQAAVEAEIEKKIRDLQQQQQMDNYIGGTLGWPLSLSISNISSGFGYRSDPFTGATKFHNGIDIPASYGTNVLAAGAGTVIVATSHYSYGNYVVIDHGGGISTLYAHNSSLTVSVGQTVTAGTVIAHVGATGSATGNHLHFGVAVNGSFVNPLGYVNQP